MQFDVVYLFMEKNMSIKSDRTGTKFRLIAILDKGRLIKASGKQEIYLQLIYRTLAVKN